MDISRIEAYNPTIKINWQILTAREIIEYKNLGAEVPDVYFEWAKEFIASINENDKDTITYEQAVTRKENTKNTATDTENNNEQNIITNTDFNKINESEDNLRDINYAKNEATSKAIININQDVKEQNKEQTLEEQMQALFLAAAQCQIDLNSEYEHLNNNDKDFSYQKVLELQNLLAQYNNQGKINIANARTDFNLNENNKEILNPNKNNDFKHKNITDLENIDNNQINSKKLQKRTEKSKSSELNTQKEYNKENNFEKDNVNKLPDDDLNLNKASLDEILKRKIRRGETEA